MRKTLALPLAAALLLAGCSAPDPGGDAPSGTGAPATGPGASASASATAPSASSPTSSAPSSGAPDAAGRLRHFTADELEAAARDLADGEAGARVTNEAQIAELAPAGEALLQRMEVSPAACAVFMNVSVADQLERAEVAGVSLPGTSETQETTVNFSSYEDRAELQEDQGKGAGMVQDCGEFTMNLGGQTVTTTVSALEAETSAESTTANATTVLAADRELSTVTVAARDGHVVVSGSVTGLADEAEALGLAAEAAERGLEALRSR